MSLTCTRCDGTGFLNIPDEGIDEMDPDEVRIWIINHDTDISLCDCCGDGDEWYGYPGEHYNQDDPPGRNGPYAYNGGLCECQGSDEEALWQAAISRFPGQDTRRK